MKKTIAIAVSTIFAASAAYADSGNVTIYGKVRAGVEFLNADANLAATTQSNGKAADYNDPARTSQTKVSTFKSRIGFKGTEDLGNGLQTLWQVESGFSADDGSTDTLANNKKLNANGILGSRDTFIGLASADLGTLKLGRITSPYDNVGTKFDGFVGSDRINGFFEQTNTDVDTTTVDGTTAASGYKFPYNVKQNRKNNAIHYTSPKIGGVFDAAVEYYLGENASSTQSSGKGISARLSYANNGLYIDLGLEQNKTGTSLGTTATSSRGNKETATLLSIGYDVLPTLTVGGQLYSQKNNAPHQNTTIASTKDKGYGVFANYKATNALTLRSFFGHIKAELQNNIDDTSDYTLNRTVLGAHYAFSKRTFVFGEFLQDNTHRRVTSATKGNTKARTVSIGISHDF